MEWYCQVLRLMVIIFDHEISISWLVGAYKYSQNSKYKPWYKMCWTDFTVAAAGGACLNKLIYLLFYVIII